MVMQYDLHFQWPKRDREIEREEIEKRQTDLSCPYSPLTTALTVPHGDGNGQE